MRTLTFILSLIGRGDVAGEEIEPEGGGAGVGSFLLVTGDSISNE
jgi:hypothetical protein